MDRKEGWSKVKGMEYEVRTSGELEKRDRMGGEVKKVK
jgi:hypothetical protein